MAIVFKNNKTLGWGNLTEEIYWNASVTRDGLLLNLDAADIDSYPGSGTTWFDTSGNGNNCTITGPSWSMVQGARAFNFTASGHQITRATTIGSVTTELTMEVWFCRAATEVISGDMGGIVLLTGGHQSYLSYNKSTNNMASYWYGHFPEGYHETIQMPKSTWLHAVTVWDNRNVYQYVNGIMNTVLNVTGTSSTNTGLNIGNQSAPRQIAGGLAIVRIYNRGLHPFEVMENYHAVKGRFGI
jgi:hypothetical protein